MLNSPYLRAWRRIENNRNKGSFRPLIILTIALLVFLTIVALAPLKAHANAIVITSGTSSWYGQSGDHTDPWKHTHNADGSRFNENALTCASWQYPFGTHLKVTNLNNGKFVHVTVRDRGPGKRLYRKGRIIDLSRGAFSRIADLKSGVIPVSIQKEG